MAEIIYILTNEAMPDYIKIGFTKGNIEKRLRQLDRTGLPLPFEVYYAAEVDDAEKDEAWLHSIFSDRRVRDSREFFKMNPEYAALALKRIAISDLNLKIPMTCDEEKEVEEAKERRARFRFANYGIPIGSVLTFTRDPNVVAEVVGNDKIKVNDTIDSMSRFAGKFLGCVNNPQGTRYFMFDGEILDDRRKRMDAEACSQETTMP